MTDANTGYKVFALKWRPQQFRDIVGQGHVTTTLSNAIAMGRVGHAYLFTGPRGIGKTSTARILAKALNCEKGPSASPCDACPSCRGIVAGNSMDVLEIDGASNRGIDQIRELRENARFAPSSSRYKIYIIDEVHQITSDAFNALLKTLEEPPAHVKFFFATTEPHRVPATILSRCQRFDLRSISAQEIVSRLSRMAKEENISIQEGACFAIARYAQGSMRDAESILDQLVSFSEGEIKEGDVISMLGLVGEKVMHDMTEALISGDYRRGLEIIAAVAAEGKELPLFLADWISYLREILRIVVLGEDEGLSDLSPEMWKSVVAQSKRISLDGLLYVLEVLMKADQQMKWALSPRILMELSFIKAAKAREISSLPDILKKVRAMEQRLSSSAPVNNDEQKAPSADAQASPAHTSAQGGKKPDEGKSPGDDAAKIASASDPVSSGEAGDAPLARAAESDETLAERIRGVWHGVLDRVGMIRPLLKSCLIEGSPGRVEGGALIVGFPEDRSYHCDSLANPRDRQLVKRILSEKLGVDINVRFETALKPQKSEHVPTPRKEVQNLKKNPLIQSALEMFGARVVEIKK